MEEIFVRKSMGRIVPHNRPPLSPDQRLVLNRKPYHSAMLLKPFHTKAVVAGSGQRVQELNLIGHDRGTDTGWSRVFQGLYAPGDEPDGDCSCR